MEGSASIYCHVLHSLSKLTSVNAVQRSEFSSVSPVAHCINILAIIITVFSRRAGVWEVFFYVNKKLPIHS